MTWVYNLGNLDLAANLINLANLVLAIFPNLVNFRYLSLCFSIFSHLSLCFTIPHYLSLSFGQLLLSLTIFHYLSLSFANLANLASLVVAVLANLVNFVNLANLVLAIFANLVNLANLANLANLVLAIFTNFANLAMFYYLKDKTIFHRNKNFHHNFNSFQKLIRMCQRKSRNRKSCIRKIKLYEKKN